MEAAIASEGPATLSPRRVRSEEVRAALERALAAVEADERVGPLIASNELRLRFEFTDSGLSLDLAVAERGGALRWSATSAPGWLPEFTLAMSSEVANRYLQGRESLAIAIARGQARVSGGARAALRCLPATRMIAERYRRIVQADFPGLAV